MRLLTAIFFAVLCISQCFGDDCVNFDDCVKSIPNALASFQRHMAKDIQDSRKERNQFTPSLAKLISDFNKDVRKGDINCRYFMLKQSKHIAFAKVIRACKQDQFDEEANGDLKKLLKEFPVGFIYETDEEKKKKYCEPLVKVGNFYCNRFDNRRKAIAECDVGTVFNELFRKKWEDCISQ